jgi:chaperonin GroES
MEEETMTKGGILLPDSATEKPSRGEVIAVGPGKSDKGVLSPLTVKVGDKVLFGKYAGTEVNVENEDVIVMREDDIMGIIE